MDKEEYLDQFKSDDKRLIDSKHLEAHKFAVDTRKFEIELYWKRATYFWAFIAVTFAGYGLAQKIALPERNLISFFLCCFGFILSLAWYFANRGSKQWQENWESHVDHLEDKITGPLYKTVLRRQKPKGKLNWINFILTGPSKHSVSKINQLISLYITLMWVVLVYNSQDNWNVKLWSIEERAIGILTILAFIGIVIGARTSSKSPGHYIHTREPKIVEK